MERLVVRQRLEADEATVFHGPRPTGVGVVVIEAGGDLRSALQGYWLNKKDGGFFSPLHRTRELKVWSNPEALRDLLAYAEGAYPLDERWQREPLGGLAVEVDCTAGDLAVVEQLGQHVKSVAVRELRTPLGAENAVTVDCSQCVFTESRTVEPQSLLVGADAKRDRIDFLDADAEVRVPELAVGPQSSLRAVVYNCWGDKMADSGHSLLWHAEALTIKGSPEAIRDLAAYTTWELDVGGVRWPVRPLRRCMQLAIEGVADCEREIGILVGHFGDVTVDKTPNGTRWETMAG